MEKSLDIQVACVEPTIIYAGLWLRLAAALIDLVAIFVPACVICFIVVVTIKLVTAAMGRESSALVLIVLPLVVGIATWLYFAIMESSSWQATLGKKSLGLYVSDMTGHRLTFRRATWRTFAKCISSLTAGFGFVLCAFTKKKQALHDVVANCMVLRHPRLR
jgi:uncharacterized RDD family membrane protein YckC